MISTSRNIRQRCQLKYSKHGTFTWVDKIFFFQSNFFCKICFFAFDKYKFKDKWTEYDCIFSSFIDANNIQQNQLELHSKNNLYEPNGKIIDLKQLRSLTCLHGNVEKNEPKNIIILKIDGKKHRLGFDNIYDYTQWKTLLDAVYNSTWDMTNKYDPDENAAVNMLYESANGKQRNRMFTNGEKWHTSVSSHTTS